MVKEGSQKNKNKNENGGKFIDVAEIGGICNMHYWHRGDGRPWLGLSTFTVVQR